MKWLTYSFLLWFAVSLFTAIPANGEQLSLDFGEEEKALLTVLKGYSNKFSVGITLGQEYRLVQEEKEELVNGRRIIRKNLTAKSQGIITLLALKYQIKDYLRAFGSYGYSHREFFDGSQVAALGVEYTGLLIGESYAGANVGVGCDVDNLKYVFTNLTVYDCFAMIGVVIGGDIVDF